MTHEATHKNCSQDRDKPLAVAPAHLLDQLDACDDIARAARAKEEAVVLHKIARHRHSFRVGDPEFE